MNLKYVIIAVILFSFCYNHSIICQTKIIAMREDNIFIAPCSINGIQKKFIFEKGTDNASISLTESKQMIKQKLLVGDDIIGASLAQIMNGKFKDDTKIILHEIELGGLKLTNVNAKVVKDLSTSLLLGELVISKLGEIQIEESDNSITILIGANNKSITNDNSQIVTNKPTVISNKNIDSDPCKTPYVDYTLIPEYTGEVNVYLYAPILDKPEVDGAKQIGIVENTKVNIIKRETCKYYYVNSGNVTGYLFVGWIKGKLSSKIFTIRDSISLSDDQLINLAKTNFEKFYKDNNEGDDIGTPDISEILLIDYNNDGNKDPVIFSTLNMGKWSVYSLMLCKNTGENLIYLDQYGFGGVNVSFRVINNYSVQVKTTERGPNDPFCCPSMKKTITLNVTGGKFKEN